MDILQPIGGITLKKYAAVTLALGMTRAALYCLQAGDDGKEEANRVLGLTSMSALAQALECSESDLAISWGDHLSTAELNRIKGFS